MNLAVSRPALKPRNMEVLLCGLLTSRNGSLGVSSNNWVVMFEQAFTLLASNLGGAAGNVSSYWQGDSTLMKP